MADEGRCGRSARLRRDGAAEGDGQRPVGGKRGAGNPLMGAAKPDPDRAARPGRSSDTAVTRSRKLVVIVGQPRALAIAVRGVQARRRWSKLREWLGGKHEATQRSAAGTIG